MIIDDPSRRGAATSVRAICFPHEDEVLTRRVQETLDAWASAGVGASPEALTAALGGSYPQLRVSVREPIAELWETDETTWYVFRDGSLLSTQGAADKGNEAASA